VLANSVSLKVDKSRKIARTHIGNLLIFLKSFPEARDVKNLAHSKNLDKYWNS
jgi:hypothetical protein